MYNMVFNFPPASWSLWNGLLASREDSPKHKKLHVVMLSTLLVAQHHPLISRKSVWPWGPLVPQVQRQNSRGYEIHTVVIECRIVITGYPGFCLLRSSHSGKKKKGEIWDREETDLSVIYMLTGRQYGKIKTCKVREPCSDMCSVPQP